MTSIGEEAFRSCSGLTSVTIPGSMTSIGSYAFWMCSNINNVRVLVTDFASFCENKIIGLIYSNIKKTVQLIDGEGAEIKEYVVPEGVTTIGNSAFRYCSGLTSVTIPDGVTSIGGSAFRECSGLTSVTIPNSVTSIGEEAFRSCSGLTSVTIPGSMTSIGSYAFWMCSNINNVRVLVTDFASFCENIVIGIIYSDIGKSVQLIDGEGAEIKEYVVPEGVTSIGNNAFVNCSGLTSVTISNGVMSIGGSAFDGCSGLTSVTIGNSVASIGQNAFIGCTSLMTVKSYITEPYNISRFSEDTYRNGTLYVPAGTKDLYIRFDGWREFLKIEEMEQEQAPNGQCATPNIMIAGKAFKFSCETPDAEFESILTTEEHFTGNELPMENREIVYTLTVYATAPGYDRSEPAKLSFTVDRTDVNQDGTVDVADIAAIIDKMAGK